MLLLGQPGAGKTITLMVFAREAATARLHDPAQPLPLLVPISSWDVYKQPAFADWLRDFYETLQSAPVAQAIDAGQTLLLLDGLDELGADKPLDPSKPDGDRFDPRLRFVQHLNTFAASHTAFSPLPEGEGLGVRVAPSTSILVTCRPKDYADIGAKIDLRGAVTLKPLDTEQMAAYLQEQPELLAAIQQDAGLREVAQTPLLLSLFAYAYRDLSADERAELANLQHAGDIRDKIFRYYVERRYQQEEARLARRGEHMPFTLSEIYDYMGRLTWEKAEDYSAQENVLTPSHFWLALPANRRASFIEHMTRLHLLATSEGETYSFFHLLLHDHFAYPYASARLRDSNSYIRGRAAAALWEIGDLRAIEPLIAALRDPEEYVRAYAAHALGQVGDARAVEPLITTLHDPRDTVRDAAAYALGQIGDARAAEPLIVVLHDPKSFVRPSAAKALGQIGDVRAVEPLIAALRDSNRDVRYGAAFALGQIGDVRAVEPLISALSDPDEFVIASVDRALERIGTPEAIAAVAAYWRGEIKPREADDDES